MPDGVIGSDVRMVAGIEVTDDGDGARFHGAVLMGILLKPSPKANAKRLEDPLPPWLSPQIQRRKPKIRPHASV
jgi:hypothetical protein